MHNTLLFHMCLSAHGPVMLNCVITQLNFSKNYSVTDIHKYTDFYLYKRWLRLHCKAENIPRNMCEFIWNLSWSTHLIPHSVNKVGLEIGGAPPESHRFISLYTTVPWHGQGRPISYATNTHPKCFFQSHFSNHGAATANDRGEPAVSYGCTG